MEKFGKGLSESLEDYLETILHLEKTNKVARVKDIADKMGVLRGSVTGALKNLAEKDLINYVPYSYITLTPKGKSIAGEVTRRHRIIKDFLANLLQMEPKDAEENACRMEHAMDKAAIDRLVRFIEYIQDCPRTGDEWLSGFADYYNCESIDRDKCRKCIDEWISRHQKAGSAA